MYREPSLRRFSDYGDSGVPGTPRDLSIRPLRRPTSNPENPKRTDSAAGANVRVVQVTGRHRLKANYVPSSELVFQHLEFRLEPVFSPRDFIRSICWGLGGFICSELPSLGCSSSVMSCTIPPNGRPHNHLGLWFSLIFTF
jgi:hypothetical protein